MKPSFSVVIVCKNEAAVIAPVLQSVQAITDNVIVYDNGSTDNTVQVVQQFPNVQLHQGTWQGFGKTKRAATALAKHDWILSLDADEVVDKELQQQLTTLTLNDTKTVYNIRFKNFLGGREVKWGEWGFDWHIRLFNRQQVTWNEAPVHEELVLTAGITTQKLKGSILHYTMKDVVEYSQKMVKYALLNAEKYHARGKKATAVKRYLSPLFAFVKYYFFMLGFLDGWNGLLCARMTAFYTFLKYARLHEIEIAAKEWPDE